MVFVLGCSSIRSNIPSAFLFLGIVLFQTNGVSTWHVVDGNGKISAELSEEAQANVSHTTLVLTGLCLPGAVPFLWAASIPCSAYEDEGQAAARAPGSAVAPFPFVVIYDGFVSEGIVASVVVFFRSSSWPFGAAGWMTGGVVCLTFAEEVLVFSS